MMGLDGRFLDSRKRNFTFVDPSLETESKREGRVTPRMRMNDGDGEQCFYSLRTKGEDNSWSIDWVHRIRTPRRGNWGNHGKGIVWGWKFQRSKIKVLQLESSVT